MVTENTDRIKEVTEVLVVYGLWDIIARIEAKSLSVLTEFTDMQQIVEIGPTSTLTWV